MKQVTVFAAMAILTVMSAFLTACDSSTDDVAAAEVSEGSELYTALSSDLELSAEQSSRLRGVLSQRNRFDREPGFLWILADSLHSTLNDRQIERLLNRDFVGNGRFDRERRNGRRAVDERGRFRRDSRGDGAFLLHQIDLTEEQREAIQQIREESRKQIQELVQQRRSGAISEEDFREAMKGIRESTREEIAGIITDEQKAQLESLREEGRAHGEQRREEASEVRNRVLGLTDAEAAAFDEITRRLTESSRALREQVRNGELTGEQAREQIRANRDAADEALKALLREDQYEVVQIYRALRFRPGLGHRRLRGHAGS